VWKGIHAQDLALAEQPLEISTENGGAIGPASAHAFKRTASAA
jgi:hypothetical protein